jgi:hypothetical protein
VAGWISVKDEMPPSGEQVLVVVVTESGKMFRTLGTWWCDSKHVEEGAWGLDFPRSTNPTPTYWAQILALPKEAA